MARFVTYSVAVLVSTADGLAKFPTRAEIAAQFPFLLGRFLGQLDDRVMLQIGWSFNCFHLASGIALEKHPVVFLLPVGWQRLVYGLWASHYNVQQNFYFKREEPSNMLIPRYVQESKDI
jgi:hypothetical protein